MARIRSRILTLFTLLVLAAGPARAQRYHFHPVHGPARVTLGDHLATVSLPEGYLYLNQADTQELMKHNGNPPDGREVGSLMRVKSSFIVLIEWRDDGYVKDDDADKLDAGAILQQIKDGTEAANEKRKEMGFDPVHVVGWAEPPHYDRDRHFVIWGVEGRGKEGPIINYNTRMLGRHGVLSLNLLTDKKGLTDDKPYVGTLIDNTSFVSGERYVDFKSGTDKVSTQTLTTLILGGGAVAAAAKLGLLAKAGKLVVVVILALKKFFILVVAAIAAFFKKLFGRKETAPPA